MSGKASSSQPSMGLGGLGALSHVYIQYPPLHCSTMGSTSVHYDDGNKLLISTASNQVNLSDLENQNNFFSWNMHNI